MSNISCVPCFVVLNIVLGTVLSTAGCGVDDSDLVTDGPSASAATTTAAATFDPEEARKAEALGQTLFYVQAMDKFRKKAVRKTLELNEDQIAVIDRLGVELDAMTKEAQASTAEQTDQIGKRFEGLTQKIDQEVRASLTQDQFDAVRVTVVQEQVGATVFLMPGVRKALELTESQLDEIRAIIGAHNDDLQPRNFTLWNLRKLIALGRRLRVKAESHLTESQHEAWQEVLAGERPLID